MVFVRWFHVSGRDTGHSYCQGAWTYWINLGRPRSRAPPTRLTCSVGSVLSRTALRSDYCIIVPQKKNLVATSDCLADTGQRHEIASCCQMYCHVSWRQHEPIITNSTKKQPAEFSNACKGTHVTTCKHQFM